MSDCEPSPITNSSRVSSNEIRASWYSAGAARSGRVWPDGSIHSITRFRLRARR